MKVSIPVNHNFYEEVPIYYSELQETFSVKKPGIKKLENIFSTVYELKLKDEKLKNLKILNFKNRRTFEIDEERLILKLYSKENTGLEKQYFIQTGLYAGVLFHKGCKFNITTKYGDAFLKRMLNFVNDIYVDNEQVKSKIENVENQFLFIIAYLFIQSLEKASLLGIPKHYKQHQERSHKVRGSINFKEFLKKDIPFQGKITSNFKEQVYVQEIVDLIYLAMRKLELKFGKDIHNRLLGLNQLLKQNYSGRYINYETIRKAKTHQSIRNPMFSGFKKVLDYAEIILLDKDLIPDNENKQLNTTGYLFDIAELYELYLEKLLSKNFPEWEVSGQEDIKIYQQQFYKRSIFPDLVLKHKQSGKIIVFDAKFKKMDFKNKDIDRNDLHQIHSYSGYFKDNLIASGLIYPLSAEIDVQKSWSQSIYGNSENNIIFIIDGIFVAENHTIKDLIINEEAFINRINLQIKEILEKCPTNTQKTHS